MADLESSSSSAGEIEQESEQEPCEPELKKARIEIEKTVENSEKLEQRLGGILCCAVCLDLPRSAVYQLAFTYGDTRIKPVKKKTTLKKKTIGSSNGTPTSTTEKKIVTPRKKAKPATAEIKVANVMCSNGHLLCAGCFTHVLADARLRDEVATCPSCRVELSRASACRNLAVEKAVSELPAPCASCGKEYPRAVLQRHQDELCEERMTECQYRRLGCPWRGPYHEAATHATECPHPKRSGSDLLPALAALDSRSDEQAAQLKQLVNLLSFEKITFNDLQMKPYRTDEFVHKLFYESARFTAFNNQWVVKAHIASGQRDPTQSSERDMSYQLVLKSKSAPTPLTVHYMVLSGPFGDLKVAPKVYQAEFSDQVCEGPPVPLPLPGTAECNRLLAAKTFSFRLIMFLVSK